MNVILSPKEQELFWNMLTRPTLVGSRSQIMQELDSTSRSSGVKDFVQKMIDEKCLKWIDQVSLGNNNTIKSDIYERDKRAMAKFYSKTCLAGIDRMLKESEGMMTQKEVSIFLGILKMNFRHGKTLQEIFDDLGFPDSDSAAKHFIDYLIQEGCLYHENGSRMLNRSKSRMESLLRQTPHYEVFKEIYAMVTKPWHEEFG